MKKRIIVGSALLAFVVVLIVYFMFVAIREDNFSKLEGVFAHFVRDYIYDLRSGIYDGYFCWDEMRNAVERGNMDFISSVVPDILEDYPVKGVEISGGGFDYTIPSDFHIPDCPSTPDVVWCEGNLILNIPIADSSGRKKLEGVRVEVVLDLERIIERSFKEYNVEVGSARGTQIISGLYLYIQRPSVFGLKSFIVLSIIYVTSYSAFWKVITRYTRYVRDESILLSLVTMLEKRDPYTAGHSKKVARFAKDFAKSIGVGKGKLREIYMAGLLHDIGKIAIPERILLKPGPLTDEEYEVIKKHPVISQEILETFEGYENIARIVRYHHERCNGEGYPDGLTCDEIPIESKIISIVDVYEALTSDRAYRNRWSREKALDFIEKSAGEIFDEYLAKKFVEFMKKRNWY